MFVVLIFSTSSLWYLYRQLSVHNNYGVFLQSIKIIMKAHTHLKERKCVFLTKVTTVISLSLSLPHSRSLLLTYSFKQNYLFFWWNRTHHNTIRNHFYKRLCHPSFLCVFGLRPIKGMYCFFITVPFSAKTCLKMWPLYTLWCLFLLLTSDQDVLEDVTTIHTVPVPPSH